MANKIIVIDLETTGLNFNEDVIEITAKEVNFESGEVTTIVDTLTKPTKPISKTISEITKITNEMVADEIDFRIEFMVLANKINRMLDKGDNVYIAAHNASFEFKFLAHYLPQNTFKQIKWICTRANFSMEKFGEVDRYKKGTKLVDAAAHSGIDFDNTKAHRAGYDVDVTILVLNRQMKQFTLDEMQKYYRQIQ